jgi:hypothetical protein
MYETITKCVKNQTIGNKNIFLLPYYIFQQSAQKREREFVHFKGLFSLKNPCEKPKIVLSSSRWAMGLRCPSQNVLRTNFEEAFI